MGGNHFMQPRRAEADDTRNRQDRRSKNPGEALNSLDLLSGGF